MKLFKIQKHCVALHKVRSYFVLDVLERKGKDRDCIFPSSLAPKCYTFTAFYLNEDVSHKNKNKIKNAPITWHSHPRVRLILIFFHSWYPRHNAFWDGCPYLWESWFFRAWVQITFLAKKKQHIFTNLQVSQCTVELHCAQLCLVVFYIKKEVKIVIINTNIM